MNIGDKLSVQIEGTDVAEAIIENIEDGHATIIIPATRIVVKVRQNLDLTATRTPEVDRVFAGLENEPEFEDSAAVDRQNNTAPVAPQTAPAAPLQYGSDIGEGIHERKSFPGEME